MKIYQVLRNTPYGDCEMGTYSNAEEAKKHKDAWNAGEDGKPRNSMDKAWIVPVTVKEKYEPEFQNLGR